MAALFHQNSKRYMPDLQLVRSLFLGSGFSTQGKSSELPENWHNLKDGEQLAPILHYLDPASPADLLTILFALGLPCQADEARRAFGPETLLALERTGFVEVAGLELRPAVTVQMYDALLIASDHCRRKRESDYVMGLSAPTCALAGLTIRKPASLAVDIGCGSGLHGLLASRHSAHVLACDVNLRALDFANLNAMLNGISNFEVTEADMFDFELDRPADLVVCNPPYVISPDCTHIYKDSGQEGDAICAHLAGLLPKLLRTGGTAQFLANWAIHEGHDISGWQHRLESWFAGTEGHISVLHELAESPADYAVKWLRQSDQNALAADDPSFERWMAYFDRLGIRSVAYGLVTIQRSEDGNRSFSIDQAPDRYSMPCGVALEAFLARKRQVHLLGEKMLDLRLQRADGLRLAQTFCHDGRWVAGPVRASLNEGLCWSEDLEPEAAMVFELVDGVTTLGALLDDIFQGGDAATTPDSVLSAVASAIEKGMLIADIEGPDGVAPPSTS